MSLKLFSRLDFTSNLISLHSKSCIFSFTDQTQYLFFYYISPFLKISACCPNYYYSYITEYAKLSTDKKKLWNTITKEVSQEPLEDHWGNVRIRKLLNLGETQVLMIHTLTKQETNQEGWRQTKGLKINKSSRFHLED